MHFFLGALRVKTKCILRNNQISERNTLDIFLSICLKIHMFGVLKRIISLRLFFYVPTINVLRMLVDTYRPTNGFLAIAIFSLKGV